MNQIQIQMTNFKNLGKKLLKWIIIILIVYFLGSIAWNKVTSKTQEVVITKTETKVIEGKDTYMIYTNKGVFRNSDQWLEFKYNSSNVYSILVPDKTYTIRSVGIRSTWFSKYPNIITAERVIKTQTSSE